MTFLRKKVFNPTVFKLHRHCNLPADSVVFTSLCLLLSSREHFVPLGHSWSICGRQIIPLQPCIKPMHYGIRLSWFWSLNGGVLWNALLYIKGDWPAVFYKVLKSEKEQCDESGNRTWQSSSLRDCQVFMENKAAWSRKGWWLSFLQQGGDSTK